MNKCYENRAANISNPSINGLTYGTILFNSLFQVNINEIVKWFILNTQLFR